MMIMIIILAFCFALINSQVIINGTLYDETKCTKGGVQDCYSVNVWGHLMPSDFGDPDCAFLATEYIYETEKVEGSNRVYMTVGIGLIDLIPSDENYTEYCASDAAKNDYTLSIFVKANGLPTETDNDGEILVVKRLDENYEKVDDDATHILEMVRYLDSKDYVLYVETDETTAIYSILVKYNHPIEEYKCKVSLFLYTCWIKDLVWKIVGIVAAFVFFICCCNFAPVFFCGCCLCQCACLSCSLKNILKMKKKKKRKLPNLDVSSRFDNGLRRVVDPVKEPLLPVLENKVFRKLAPRCLACCISSFPCCESCAKTCKCGKIFDACTIM